MTDTTNTETATNEQTPEGDIPDATPDVQPADTSQDPDPEADHDDPEVFPREVVEKLRQENGRYRQRAQQADELAKRLHTELVRTTGRLADPTDLPFDEDHIADPDKLTAALDELLDAKPHLASRRPAGDIGQGNRGAASGNFSLLDMLKERA